MPTLKKSLNCLLAISTLFASIFPSGTVFAVDFFTENLPAVETMPLEEENLMTGLENYMPDFSEMDWDGEIILLEDYEQYNETRDQLIEAGDYGALALLTPEKHKMTDDAVLDYYNVPAAVREIIEGYRSDGKDHDEVGKQNLKFAIQAVQPSKESDQIEYQYLGMDYGKDTQEEKFGIIDLKKTEKLKIKKATPFSDEKKSAGIQKGETIEAPKADSLSAVTLDGLIAGEKVEPQGTNKAGGTPDPFLIEYYEGIENNALDFALYYLSKKQNTDGSWGDYNIYEQTGEIILMLSRINRTNNNQYIAARNYLINGVPQNTREKAIKARLMIGLGQPYLPLLDEIVTLKNGDHGYGFDKNYPSDIQTTMEVALAMYAGNYSIQDKLPLALLYVLRQIPANGELKYTDDANASFYLVNRTAQYLKPFQAMSVGDEQTQITVQSKLDLLLNFLNSRYEANTESLTGAQEVIDEMMTVRTWQVYNVNPEARTALIPKIKNKQYGDGSFENSYKATFTAFDTINQPDLDLISITATSSLVNRTAASFELMVGNRGYASNVDGKIYIFADDYKTTFEIDLAANGIFIEPAEAATVNLTIPSTDTFIGDTPFKFYLENSNDFKYEDNWIEQNFTFASDEAGAPALPPFYVTFNHVISGAPNALMAWKRKDDSNRLNYVFMYRPQGTTAWNYIPVDDSWSSVFVGTFPEGATYELTLGVVHLNGSNVSYFNNYTRVTMSGSESLYTGSASGSVTEDNLKLGDANMSGYGVSGRADANGDFSYSNLKNGVTAAYAAAYQYDQLKTKFPVNAGQTTQNVRIFTKLKADEIPPVITEASFLEGRYRNRVNNQTELTLFANGNDNVALKKADFYLWDPADSFWTYLGSDSFDGYQVHLPFYLSEQYVGAGFQLKAIAWDYKDNQSAEYVWGPFTIVSGTPPTLTITAPNGGETFNLGDNMNITWQTSEGNSVPKIDIYSVYPNNGLNYIRSDATNTGSYTWPIPNNSTYAGTQVKIKVYGEDNANYLPGEDLSDDYFTIADNSPDPLLPWARPQVITESRDNCDLERPLVGYNSNGDLKVVYHCTQDLGGTPRIIVERLYQLIRPQNGTWGPSEMIYEKIWQTDSNFNGYQPIQELSMELDNNGNPNFVWQSRGGDGCDGINDQEMYSYYYDGTAWVGPVNISNNSTETREPDFTKDSAGNTYVAWLDGGVWDSDCHFTGPRKIYYRKKTQGAAWSAIEQISPGQYPGSPSIAITADGKVNITFRNGSLDGNSDKMSHIYKTTSWSSPVDVFSGQGDSPELESYANNLHYAYREYFNDPVTSVWRSRVLYSYYNGTSWTPAVEVSPVWTNYSAETPQIAVHDNIPHITYLHYNSPASIRNLAWTTKDSSGSWRLPQAVNLESQQYQDRDYSLISGAGKLFAVFGNYYAYKKQLYVAEADLTLNYLPPAPVQNLALTPVIGEVTLSWDLYNDVDGDFDHFNIYRTPNPNDILDDLTPVHTITALTAVNYSDADVTPETDYYYAVTVVDNNGNENKNISLSGPVQALPLPPTEPTELRISPSGEMNTLTPAFSAKYNNPNPAEKAVGTKVQVATDSNFLNLLWDSQTINSNTDVNGFYSFDQDAFTNDPLTYDDVILDESGGTRNITLGNTDRQYVPTWTADGAVDGAYNFNGRQWLTLGDPGLNNTNHLSFEVWAKTDKATGFSGLIGPMLGMNSFVYIYTSSGNLYARLFTPQTDYLRGGRISDNAWHHIAVTWDGQTSKLYLDGNFVDDATTVGTRLSGSQNGLFIGRHNVPTGQDPFSRQWKGGVDEFAIYKKTLTADEIKNHYDQALLGQHPAGICDNGERCEDIVYNEDGTAQNLNFNDGDVNYYWRMRFEKQTGELTPWSTEEAVFTLPDAASPNNPQVNNQTNPVNITGSYPFFSALYNSDDPDSWAASGAIQVSIDQNFGSFMWDSGKIDFNDKVEGFFSFENAPFANAPPILGDYLADESGKNHNITPGALNSANVPVIITDGALGAGYHFDGNDWLVFKNTGLKDLNKLSVEFWVRAPVGANTYGGIIGTSVGMNSFMSVYLWNNSLYARLYATSTEYLKGGRVDDNEWHHVAITWDGSKSKLYLDGIMIDDASTIGTRLSGSQNGLFIGKHNVSATEAPDARSLDGDLDEMTFFSRVLTAQEVESHYASGAPQSHPAGNCDIAENCPPVTYGQSGTFTELSLNSGITYYWRIKFYDLLGVPGDWTPAQTFTMAN